MALVYDVFRNDPATGGPVDESAPYAAGVTSPWSDAPLPFGSRARYLVRARDTVAGLTERNVEATVRVVTGPAGEDRTARPNAPGSLAADPAKAGAIRVAWTYNPGGQGGPPTGAKVWVTAGGAVDYAAAPAATVPYVPGVVSYATTIAGFIAGTAYRVGVRMTNGSGDDPNVASVGVVADGAGPDPVDGAAASVVG